jgi:hypothetical protein
MKTRNDQVNVSKSLLADEEMLGGLRHRQMAK